MPLDQALFVSESVIEREVELADGKKHTFWFREVPSVKFRAFQIAETSGDEQKRLSSMFVLIAASVCEPDGKPALSAEQAAQLKPTVTSALMAEILKINRIGGDEKKTSQPEAKSGSGTSSPSLSEADR